MTELKLACLLACQTGWSGWLDRRGIARMARRASTPAQITLHQEEFTSLPSPKDLAAEAILTRLRNGEQTRDQAFDGIYRLYYSTVLYWFRRWGCFIEESEELTQETFFRLYTYIEGFRGERSFRIYLSRIARRVLTHQLRDKNAQKRHPGVIESISQKGADEPAASEPGSLPIQEEELLGAEAAALLRKAVSELPRQQRRCILLRYFAGNMEHEVAELLNLARGTVKANLSQARAALRKELGPTLAERWLESPGPDVK